LPSRLSLVAALAGISCGLLAGAPAEAGNRSVQTPPAAVRQIGETDSTRARELQDYFVIYRAVKGCQSLGTVFSEADVVMLEGFIQGRYSDIQPADRGRIWKESGTVAGEYIDKYYFMTPSKREAECRDVANIAAEVGLDLPSQR